MTLHVTFDADDGMTTSCFVLLHTPHARARTHTRIYVFMAWNLVTRTALPCTFFISSQKLQAGKRRF